MKNYKDYDRFYIGESNDLSRINNELRAYRTTL